MTTIGQVKRSCFAGLCLAAWVSPVAAWTAAQNISNQPSGSRAFGPRLGRDSLGNTHCVWAGGVDPSTSWQAWYQSFNGSAWTTPASLSGANANRPSIAVDGSNTLHVAYEDDGEKDIWYRKKTSGGSWTTPLNLKTGGRSIAPSISCNAAGDRIIVAWHEDYQVGGEWDIFVNVFGGSAWSGASNISSDSTLSAYAKTAVDASNNMHVVWNSGSSILYRRRDAAGNWGSKITIRNTATRIGVCSVATSSDGLVHCLFSEDDGTGWEIFYTYYNGVAWSAPVNVSNHPGTSDDIDAALYVDVYNRLFAVWHDYTAVYYSSAPTYTSAWASRTAIVSGQYSTGAPHIVVDSGLTARVAWQARPTSASNWNIWVSSQSVGTPGPQGHIAGTVRDTYGYGVGGATVTAGAYQIATNADGTYLLSHIATGTYSVSAAAAFFTGQTVHNVVVTENGTTTVNLTIAAQLPAPVTGVTATIEDNSITLRWTTPSSANFTGTLVRYKTSGFPTGPTDGTLLIDKAAAPSTNQVHTHGGLLAGQTYYYALYAHDGRPVPTYAGGMTIAGMPPGPTDFDGDGDTDLDDFAHFQTCYAGPNRPPTLPSACGDADLDQDGDVDLMDFATFSRCFNGPNRPPVVGCAGS